MSEEKKANVTLDQMWVVAAYDRVVAAAQVEAELLRVIGKLEPAEQMETIRRHLAKHRDEFLAATQRSIVIADAGVIQQLATKH